MSTQVLPRCSLCACVVAPNEVLGVSACSYFEEFQRLGDSNRRNRGNPVAAARLLSFGKAVYRALPKRLRVIAGPVTFFFYRLLSSLRPQVWSVIGDLKGTTLPISICMYSTTAPFRNYASKLMLDPSYCSIYLGRTWVWNTHKPLKAASAGSVLFSEIEAPLTKLLRAGCGVSIPAWVHGEVALPRNKRKKERHNSNYLRTKIHKHSLELEISHDQRRFDDFYDNMYVPYTRHRFGESAQLAPREEAQADFRKGELLLVRRQGEYISGQLITYENSCMSLRILGVRDGNWDYVRDGAVAALYEFALGHAEEKGCRKVRFYKSRAFLEDGVLRFKRTMSQRIVEADDCKSLLRIESASPAARAFLENSPFIFERFGQLHGAVFLNGETPLTVEVLRNMNKQYFHPGMTQLVVFQFAPATNIGAGGAAPGLSAERSSNHLTDPSDLFCYKQLSNAEWTDLIRGIGCAGIGRAFAIYPKCANGTARKEHATDSMQGGKSSIMRSAPIRPS